jgi:hypothetical protein
MALDSYVHVGMEQQQMRQQERANLTEQQRVGTDFLGFISYLPWLSMGYEPKAMG